MAYLYGRQIPTAGACQNVPHLSAYIPPWRRADPVGSMYMLLFGPILHCLPFYHKHADVWI